jgi:hypothetical protein
VLGDRHCRETGTRPLLDEFERRQAAVGGCCVKVKIGQAVTGRWRARVRGPRFWSACGFDPGV